jgi:Arc/MetJ family transcription regulator
VNFFDFSHAFRKGHGQHRALHQLREKGRASLEFISAAAHFHVRQKLTLYALNANFMHNLLVRRPMMRTTLDLPEDLIDEAMKATQINTKTKVIITALEDLIRKSKISGLKEFKGKVDLDIDMNAVRGRQCRY